MVWLNILCKSVMVGLAVTKLSNLKKQSDFFWPTLYIHVYSIKIKDQIKGTLRCMGPADVSEATDTYVDVTGISASSTEQQFQHSDVDHLSNLISHTATTSHSSTAHPSPLVLHPPPPSHACGRTRRFE